MDFHELAKELLQLRIQSIQEPASRLLSDMARGESFVLNCLLMHGMKAHPKELSKDMAVSTARIAALLNHMEEKGLFTRQDDPNDNRQVIVSLTPEGNRAIGLKRGEAVESVARMLEHLGEEDAREYLRILRKIIQNSTLA